MTRVPLELSEIPEENLDLAEAALRLEKELWPDLDIDFYLAQIDRLTRKAAFFSQKAQTPLERIGYLNTYFFKIEGFEYKYSDPLGHEPGTGSLRELLDTRAGNCLSLPLLYLIVAQRLGYPVRGVTAPAHFFVRYVDPELKEQNIDPASYGGHDPDERYIENLKISKKSIQNGIYLRTLTNKEVLAELVVNAANNWFAKYKNASTFDQVGGTNRSISYLNIAEKLNPKSDLVFMNLVRRWRRKAELTIETAKSFPVNMGSLPRQEAMAYIAVGSRYKKHIFDVGITQNDYYGLWKVDYLKEANQNRIEHEERRKEFRAERKKLLRYLPEEFKGKEML